MIDAAKVYPVEPAFAHTRMSLPQAVLTQVAATDPLNAQAYAQRDGELSWRDLAVASSFLKLALEAATVWEFPVDRPVVPSVTTDGTLYFKHDPSDLLGTAAGDVAHVLNSSIPYDAILTDKYLYNRDAVLHEVVARAAAVFSTLDIPALFPGLVTSTAWSKAEGAVSISGVGLSQPLNTALFKAPDANLAERDNQLAGYVARLVHAIMNPFEVATRLYVEVLGTSPRPPEVYALTQDDATSRVWQAEPSLDGRLRIVYHKVFKTLRWVDEQALLTHYPQPAPLALDVDGVSSALAVDGPESGQSIAVCAEKPSGPAPSHWHAKAKTINFEGNLELDGVSAPTWEGWSLLTSSGASVAFPFWSGTLQGGWHRVTALIQPINELSFYGSNAGGTSFIYVDGARQVPAGQSIWWYVTLPPGAWQARVEYTSAAAGVAQLTGALSGPVNIEAVSELSLSTAAPQGSGSVAFFTAPSNTAVVVKRLVIYEVGGAVQAEYTVTCEIVGPGITAATANFAGKLNRVDTVSFDFLLPVPTVNPYIDLHFGLVNLSNPLPLRLKQVHVQPIEAQVSTPGAGGLEYWKYEMIERAAKEVNERYARAICGTPPVPVTPPLSNTFAGRMALSTVNRAVLIGSNAAFDKEEGEPNHAGNKGGRSGWWKWTAQSSGTVTLRSAKTLDAGMTSAGSSFDVIMAVYTGASLDTLVPVASSGNGALSFYATAGVEYQIAVDGYEGAYGSIVVEFEAETPSNDRLASALAVKGYTRDIKFSTVGCEPEYLENAHAGAVARKSAWLDWSAVTNGTVRVDASPSAFDARVAVYTGSQFPLTPRYVERQGADTVSFLASTGTSYKIAIDSAGALAGDAMVHIGPEYAPGGTWTRASTDFWLNTLRAAVPDFYTAFRQAMPGDVGRPALVPRGLEVLPDGSVKSNFPAEQLGAEIATLQPWMVELGLCVARREFWPAETLLDSAYVVPDQFVITAQASPPSSGVVTGGGSYYQGSNATLNAVAGTGPTVVKPVDIVFLIDESGSMATEHAWLKSMPSKMEEALKNSSERIGVAIPNRYALVGFGAAYSVINGDWIAVSGHGAANAAHKHSVGGGDWGTADQLQTAASGLVTRGGIEDGYDAIDFVWGAGGYTFREGSVPVIILITDEERGLLRPSLSKSAIELLLGTKSAVVSFIGNLDIRDAQNRRCLGKFGTKAFVQNGASFVESTFSSVIAGPGTESAPNDGAVEDYVAISDNRAGSSWDLNLLRESGTNPSVVDAFTAAWVGTVVDQIASTMRYTLTGWTVDGLPYPGVPNSITLYNIQANHNVVAYFA